MKQIARSELKQVVLILAYHIPSHHIYVFGFFFDAEYQSDGIAGPGPEFSSEIYTRSEMVSRNPFVVVVVVKIDISYKVRFETGAIYYGAPSV